MNRNNVLIIFDFVELITFKFEMVVALAKLVLFYYKSFFDKIEKNVCIFHTIAANIIVWPKNIMKIHLFVLI